MRDGKTNLKTIVTLVGSTTKQNRLKRTLESVHGMATPNATISITSRLAMKHATQRLRLKSAYTAQTLSSEDDRVKVVD